MDVYLFAGSHPMVSARLKNPPKGVDYVTNVKPNEVSFKKLYGKKHDLKRKLFRTYNDVFRLPRKIRINTDADLIHSTRGFLVTNKKPWIVDFSYVNWFRGGEIWKSHIVEPYKTKIEKYLSSTYCKKIIPRSEACRKSFEHIFGRDEYHDKIEVVYPSIEKRREYIEEPEYPINMLFVGEFIMKGGREVIDSLDFLDFDYHLSMITPRGDIPKKYIHKIKKNDNVDLYVESVPREQLFSKFYSEADVFLFPTYIDVFGYVVLEAMTMGLPVIGTDHFAVPEIVENHVNGYLVEPFYTSFDESYQHKGLGPERYLKENINVENLEFLKEFSEKLNKMGNNPKLIKKMGNESIKLVEEKFSIETSNDIYLNIYGDALRK